MDVDVALIECYTRAIAGLSGGDPRGLQRRAEFEAEDRGYPSKAVNDSALLDYLESVGPDDPLRSGLHLLIATWDDADPAVEWTQGTDRGSEDRRKEVLARLGVDERLGERLNTLMPVHLNETVVISDDFEAWYTAGREAERSFYWKGYARYLLEEQRWDPTSVADLDASTRTVVERMADPLREEAYPTRGIVVGYVQSGKTAHFTGVIARAIDAGYRLVIVMTGTVNILREQAQRRIDMELVGRENILRGANPDDPSTLDEIDYQDDPGWSEFISWGVQPSSLSMPDIIRLTTKRRDYTSLRAGITALELERVDKSKPLYARENLMPCNARLVVVKKNAGVLRKLVRDLKQVKNHLGQIPALIVDDESDQASVNTSNPKSWHAGERERTTINRLISELLTLLPRSQYVGYTATPYANVFIDPEDAQTIFPKHYLLSLPRPRGYMGVADFHDIDADPDEERGFATSNEMARVRPLVGVTDDERAAELLHAIDAFVVTGAVKLFREKNGLPAGIFRHHTMLVHESRLKSDHRVTAALIRRLWADAGYVGGAGLDRLRTIYEKDFRPVSSVRGPELGLGPGLIPSSFAELSPFVGPTVARMTEGSGHPVVVVNSDKDLSQEPIDFALHRVWKILVGGAKLSRGFTVEGLTISYYRRVATAADTLMQMGRWFGFRRHYEDLVRLYIGRNESIRGKTVDLYKVFEAIMFDEEDFRSELRRYAETIDGVPQIRPYEIPPLVSQRVPWLLPTPGNKMFNAQLEVRRSPGLGIEPVEYPVVPSRKAENFAQMAELLRRATTRTRFARDPTCSKTFEAETGWIDHAELMDILISLKWQFEDAFRADLAYLSEAGERTEVERWCILTPVFERPRTRLLPGVGVRPLAFRTRTRTPLFHAISEPRHRLALQRIAGVVAPGCDAEAGRLAAPATGSLMLYPLVEDESLLDDDLRHVELSPTTVVVAMRIVPPVGAGPGAQPLLRFRTKTGTTQPIIDIGQSDN